MTKTKTKNKVVVGFLIAGIILLAAGAGWVVIGKANTPQGTIPLFKWNSETGEVTNPMVEAAKEILAGPDRDTSLDNINTNWNSNTNNSNTNGNSNGNTNGNQEVNQNTNSGNDAPTKNN